MNSVQPAPRNFHLMLAGQIISIMGAELLRFSLSLSILDLTGRADIFAALYAISSVPLLLSPIGGAIADRFHRRNLMVIFDFTSSAVILCFLIVFSLGIASVPATGLVMVLLSLISTMYKPTVQASIPLLVPEKALERANGLVSGVDALAGMMAPVLGGILYGLFQLTPLIVISCTAFFLSAVMELFIQIPYRRRMLKQPILPTIAGDLKEGLEYIKAQPYLLKSMGLAALLNFILTPFLIVGCPIILRMTMSSSDTMYGVGMGICQISMVAGALSIGLFAKRMHIRTIYRWLLAIGCLLLPLTLSLTPRMLGLGYYPSFLLFFAAILPMGMAMIVISIFMISLVQKRTPGHLLGKVMAILTGVSQCAAPLGQLVYGSLFKQFERQVWLPAIFTCFAMLSLGLLAKKWFQYEGVTA